VNLTRHQVDMAVYAMNQAIELSGILGARVRTELKDVL
jgi:hypothetical protein